MCCAFEFNRAFTGNAARAKQEFRTFHLSDNIFAMLLLLLTVVACAAHGALIPGFRPPSIVCRSLSLLIGMYDLVNRS